jgi:hypothetical protein
LNDVKNRENSVKIEEKISEENSDFSKKIKVEKNSN